MTKNNSKILSGKHSGRTISSIFLTTLIWRWGNGPRKNCDLLSTHRSSVAGLGLEFLLWGYQVRPLVVWSKVVLCIWVPSFTKWEESCSRSATVSLLNYFLASGEPGSPVPTCEDLRFTGFLLLSEQWALPTQDFPVWGWPDSEPPNLATGRSPSHTKSSAAFSFEFRLFPEEFSFSFLMFFWKKRNLLSGT